MVAIKYGYLTRKSGNFKNSWRNWWLVKQRANQAGGEVNLLKGAAKLRVPQLFVGKRIRFKVEVLE